jgi:type III secretion HrpO family protein
MNGDRLYQHVETSLILILQLSLPVVVVATLVGLLVGLLQALTSIQDQTLPQAVKLGAVAVVIIVLGAGMSQRLVAFTAEVFGRIAAG